MTTDFALCQLDTISAFWLFNVTTGDAYGLNLTSHMILAHCDGRHSVDDILGLLAERYPGEDRADLMRDVLDFLAAVEAEKGVRFTPGALVLEGHK